MSEYALRVSGLKELKTALKAVNSDLPKALRIAFNDVAKIVVDDAKAKVPVLTGAAKGSIKPRSTQTAVRISGGGNKVPYYPWLDFGGRVGKSNSVHRPVIADGRYIYPAYFAARDSGRIQEALTDAMDDIVRRAGLELSGG